MTSNSKDKFKQSTYNSLYKLSPLLEFKIKHSKLTPKRLKHKRSGSVMLLAFSISLPNSLESSTKTSKDESKRCKGYAYYKFIKRYLSKHINNKLRWFKAILKRYNNLIKLLI